MRGYRRKHTGADYKKPSGGYIWGEPIKIALVTENYQKMVNGDKTAGTLGMSADEAIENILLETDSAVLTLGIYNKPAENNGEESANGNDVFYNSQFHGDLYMQLKPGFKEISTQEFGYCILDESEDRWDCMQAKTTVIPSKI